MSDSIFSFNTDKSVHGLTISLVDNDPCEQLEVDIWFGNLRMGRYKVKYLANIDDNNLGQNITVFKTSFKPFKTTETIKIKIETQLHINQITVNLLTS